LNRPRVVAQLKGRHFAPPAVFFAVTPQQLEQDSTLDPGRIGAYHIKHGFLSPEGMPWVSHRRGADGPFQRVPPNRPLGVRRAAGKRLRPGERLVFFSPFPAIQFLILIHLGFMKIRGKAFHIFPKALFGTGEDHAPDVFAVPEPIRVVGAVATHRDLVSFQLKRNPVTPGPPHKGPDGMAIGHLQFHLPLEKISVTPLPDALEEIRFQFIFKARGQNRILYESQRMPGNYRPMEMGERGQTSIITV
jgi:hypothetical protein